MKSILVLSLLLSLSAFAEIKIGDTLPHKDVKMKNIDDKEVTIASVKGKNGTLVIFSCNHCPYAKAWDARIAAIGSDALRKGIGVIMVNSNDPKDYPEDSFEVMKKKKYDFPYVVDATSDVARGFGATKTPDVFMFDANDKLVYKGAVDDNSEKPDQVKAHFLKTAIEEHLAGKKIKNNVTKAVGCGIKFRPSKKG